MKRTIFLFIVFIMCVSAAAQDISSDFKTESKAALLEGNKGILLRRDRFKTNQINGLASTIKITPNILTDLSNGQKVAFVELTSIGLTSRGTSNGSFIDLDELPAIIGAMDYMFNTVINENPSHRVDVATITRDGLQIAVTHDINDRKGWSGSLYHTKYTLGEITTVSTKVLQNIRDALDESKLFLEQELLK